MGSKRLRSLLKDEVSTSDVAILLRMDPRTVQNAVKAGILTPVRRGVFILGKTIPAYVEHLRDSISNDPEEVKLRAAKLRKALADAEKSELELGRLKSELHPLDVIMFVWSSRIGASKKRLLAIPNRLAPHLVGETDQKKIYAAIHHEIALGLEDVSRLDERDFEKENRRFLKTHGNGE